MFFCLFSGRRFRQFIAVRRELALALSFFAVDFTYIKPYDNLWKSFDILLFCA